MLQSKEAEARDAEQKQESLRLQRELEDMRCVPQTRNGRFIALRSDAIKKAEGEAAAMRQKVEEQHKVWYLID